MTKLSDKQRDAIGKRIGDQGDMGIKISERLLADLIEDAGVPQMARHMRDRPSGMIFREVDAPALEALLCLACQNAALSGERGDQPTPEGA